MVTALPSFSRFVQEICYSLRLCLQYVELLGPQCRNYLLLDLAKILSDLYDSKIALSGIGRDERGRFRAVHEIENPLELT